MNLLFAFLAILALKISINLSRYIQCKWYLAKYLGYVKKPEWGFVEQSTQIVRLFKSAGVEDTTVSNVEFIGYGLFQSSQPSVFNNIALTRKDVVNLVLHMFHESIGVYRSRMLETINPLYWVELIIFLPKQVLNYVGVPAESVLIKIAQILYWVFVTIAGFLFGIYRTDLENIIRDWITKFIQ